MAAKNQVVHFSLKCSECGKRNYYKSKNRNVKTKFEFKKYCPHCDKHTLHTETKI
ncbi:MAG TPA: 50S ribosomal protein L33 [Tepiditoga sp.]|nr:50S ribosomal protein L33 [Thermotogota bacterium]HOO74068.1 50S ribosomal protein L33 [Tepiditoga sp.]